VSNSPSEGCATDCFAGGSQERWRHVLRRTSLPPDVKPLLGGGVELTPAKVLADALELGAFVQLATRGDPETALVWVSRSQRCSGPCPG